MTGGEPQRVLLRAGGTPGSLTPSVSDLKQPFRSSGPGLTVFPTLSSTVTAAVTQTDQSLQSLVQLGHQKALKSLIGCVLKKLL